MKHDDGSTVITDPRLFGAKARRRQAQAEARRRRPIPDAGSEAFRATCPRCQAPNVIMSEVSPAAVSPVPPSAGDVIICDACDCTHRVERVDGRKVVTSGFEIV